MHITLTEVDPIARAEAPGRGGVIGHHIWFQSAAVRGRGVLVCGLTREDVKPGLRLHVEIEFEQINDLEYIFPATRSVTFHRDSDTYEVVAPVHDAFDDGVAFARVGDFNVSLESPDGEPFVVDAWVRFVGHGLSLWDTSI